MRGNPESCRLDIGTLLQNELKLTVTFESILANEYRSIAERDIAALEQVIAEKTRLLDQLAGLEQQRRQTLEDAEFGSGHTAMVDCLRWCDPRQEITSLWQHLQSRARTCHDLNRRNQQLVELCSRHAREILYLLRGEEPDQETYQADGEADHRHSSRSLAKA
jgi:flagellar biosynthesis/type III secretory pathway chaperone